MNLTKDQKLSLIIKTVQAGLQSLNFSGRMVVLYQSGPDAVSTIRNVSTEEMRGMCKAVLALSPENSVSLEGALDDILSKSEVRNEH